MSSCILFSSAQNKHIPGHGCCCGGQADRVTYYWSCSVQPMAKSSFQLCSSLAIVTLHQIFALYTDIPALLHWTGSRSSHWNRSGRLLCMWCLLSWWKQRGGVAFVERRGGKGKHINKKLNWDKNKRGMDSGDNRAAVRDREEEGEKAWEVLMG